MKTTAALVHINPCRDLHDLLLAVEKPGRYVAGEFGVLKDQIEEGFGVCIVFPDLYEIGMANQAVRILYDLMAKTDGVFVDRAFTPAPDFAEGLSERNLPLFSLERGRALHAFDILAVTVGYELSFTNVLSTLESSFIPIDRSLRREDHPLVLAGGPAMSNPAPWTSIIDGVFIGEAEGAFGGTMSRMSRMKESGASRQDLLTFLSSEPGWWVPSHSGQANVVERQAWLGFGSRESGAPAALPISSLATVQDHGVIEIMRGCPNKCRFCHAGVFYRPMRQKSVHRIIEEADFLVDVCGYRDITLSSLSTGDYSLLEPMLEVLNKRYAHRKVSFSLPSLRVNSLSLSLLGSLNTVRKSGLTFAVETPTLDGQRGLNKEVPADRVVAILKEAKQKGWRQAKFYFMLGLPVDNGEDEIESIGNYLISVQRESRINMNVNVGTYIPKAHTPFERAAQLTDDQAMEQIRRLRDILRMERRIRFSFHSPFVSYLEGILSRGDQRAGNLAIQAWKKGARFDAWDDRMDRDAWKMAISEAEWDVESSICSQRRPGDSLPWDHISLGVTRKHLQSENTRAIAAELTPPCSDPCVDHCGVCDRSCKVRSPDDLFHFLKDQSHAIPIDSKAGTQRFLMSYRKAGPAIYLGHLDVMTVIERSFQRAGLFVEFSQGFNPKPRIEFAQPLALGIESHDEILTFSLESSTRSINSMMGDLQMALPDGFSVNEIIAIPQPREGRKKTKVMSVFWGSLWSLVPDSNVSAELIQSLTVKIQEASRELGVADDLTDLCDKGITLSFRFRHGGTKNHNILRLLEQILGEQPLCQGWRLIRNASYACGDDGSWVEYQKFFHDSASFDSCQ